MPDIRFHKLKEALSKTRPDQFNGIVLICGESFLVKQAFKTLCNFILDGQEDSFAVEKIEGDSISLGDIVEEVSTLSIFVPKKIVAVLNMPLFNTDKSSGQIRYNAGDLDFLSGVLETGFPDNHFLVMTTSLSDKRKKIYKTIQKHGVVIDCTISSGSRKADLDEQRSVLQALSSKILSKTNKNIESPAFQALINSTGFNLEIFAQNLEKLIVYSGKRPNITNADVQAIVVKDKKDPIFNLTNAVMDKDLQKVLVSLNSLFSEGYHPLQIMKSMENLIRKLILMKGFVLETLTDTRPGLQHLSFNQFKQSILPKMVIHDKQTISQLKESEPYITERALKKKTKTNDLLLAPNPKNAYPVYQVFQKTGKFSFDQLSQNLFVLSDLDEKLKSTSTDEKVQVESFLINLCN